MERFRNSGLFIVALTVILLFLIVNASETSADLKDNDDGRAGNRDLPNAVRGELIVQYKDSVTSCVHCLVRKHLSISHAVAGDGKNLEDLHSRYGVSSARPVFRTVEEEERMFGSTATVPTDILKQYQRNKLLMHASRFARIAGRAPAGAVLPDLHHVYVLKISETADISRAAEEFSKDPNVEYAQPNYLVQTDFNPNDKYYRSSGSWGQKYDDLWSLKQNKVDLAPAWDITQGKGVLVAVVDTGLDYKHPDIAANTWVNPKEVAGNNIDDDGNGFVDDTRGWDFVTCDEFEGTGCRTPKDTDNDPMDENFHGTHVSGTIAAVGGNKLGIIGVAPQAKIMPVRALNADGRGQNSDLAAAIVYAASNGADVINNSWSCGFCTRNPLIEKAIETAYKLGVIVVFSAGNDALNVRGKSPQNMHQFKPIIVSATNQNDRATSFTSFGSTVDVGAPGGGVRSREVNILSLRPSTCDQCPHRLLVDDQYLRLAGTSMSAPHVSGLAALILAQRPTLRNEEVRQIIRSSAKDVETPGFDFLTGAGRIYAPGALDKTLPLRISIDAPSHLSGSAPRSVPIKCTVSGPGLVGYQLSYLPENEKDWIPLGPSRSSPVNDGVLGTLPGSSLPLGWHSVKLEATTQNGKRYEDVIDFAIHLPSRQIKTRPRNAAHDPDISGNLIVFAQDVVEGETANLIVYDLKSKKKTKITDNPIAFPIPRISGNVITWLIDYMDGNQDGIYYCVYNSQTGKCPAKQISSNNFTGLPSVSGKYIVWGEYKVEDGTEPIFLYDTSTGKKRVIGDGTEVDIDGNDVVIKHVYPGRLTADLFYYNIRSKKTKQLTHNPDASEFRPQVSGGKVVFMRNHAIGKKPPHFDTYLYDLASGKETKLIEDPEGQAEIGFSDHWIVWKHSPFEMHAYDLDTGMTQRLSFYPVGFRHTPGVSGTTAVWLLRDPEKQDNGEVFYTNLE